MYKKALLMLGLLSLGPGDAVIAQTDIVNIPEAFWESGFVLNGCKIEFPCKLIDLMQTSNYKSGSVNTKIPPTGENEFWAVTLTNGKGERIEATLFNPTAQELDEADCLVNSISIGPRSDNWHNISDFAVFGLKSKTATREEVVQAIEKYCGAPAYVIETPNADYYQFSLVSR